MLSLTSAEKHYNRIFGYLFAFQAVLSGRNKHGIDAFFAENSIDTVLVSSITVVEFRSIVWRKVRMKEVSSADAQEIIRVFTHDLSLYSIVDFDDSLLQLARQLIDKYGLTGLRSLDALQLASAVTARTEVTLYNTADRLLNDLFKAEGLPV